MTRASKSLPGGWILTTLGDVFRWGSGGTPLSSRADYYGGNIPWAVIGDLNDSIITETASTITERGLRESSAKWVEPGAVLVAMYGSIGKLGLPQIRLATNQAIAFTDPKPIVAKYLFYYLMLERHELFHRGKGGTQRNISQTVLKSFPFVLAPLAEQHRIVGGIETYFTRLDAAVETLKHVQANLKRYKASVLKAAVEGRLVPTEAELARREGRDYEPASKLLERILAERRRRWEEAELAKMRAKGKEPKDDKWKSKYKEPATIAAHDLPTLPDGWCWVTMEVLTLGTPQNGLYVPKAQYGTGVPILRIDDYQSNWSRGSEALQRVDVDPETANKFSLREGDLVINRVNSPSHLGKAICVAERHLPAVFESNMMRLTLTSHAISSYITEYLNSITGKARLVARAKWAVNQASINQQDVGVTPVPLPPLEEQLRIMEDIQSRLSKSVAASSVASTTIARIARLKQSILKWAFEGKLVDQDPNDEPASVLLHRIKAEREGSKRKSGRGKGKQLELTL